jgi:phosphoglycerate dehydrogenase-like enzyme
MLAHLPDGAFVINVARGPVAVTEAIVSEATSGRLNFALDVVDPEPLPPDHALWSLPNVLITPHVGGNTDAFPVRGRRLVREQLENLLMGAPLVNVVRAGK